MNRLIWVPATWFWLLISSNSFPSTIGFGAGTQYIRPAITALKGSVYYGNFGRGYLTQLPGPENRRTGLRPLFTDFQAGMGLSYGFTSRLELGITQVFYQDNNRPGKGYNLPDDLFLYARLGSIGRRAGNLRLGFQMDLRLPTATFHNIPLEPYSSGRIGVGLMTMASIISEPLLPEFSNSLHLNAGLFMHNDFAARLIDHPQDTLTVKINTIELIIGSAVSTSWRNFGFFFEAYGRAFLRKPPINAYTRENSIYLVPGMSYLLASWLRLRMGLDWRLLGGRDQTHYNGEQGSYAVTFWDRPLNQPLWRLNFCALVSLNPQKVQLVRKREKRLRQVAVQQELLNPDEKELDELAAERKKTEEAEAELERIRLERQRMEDLLDRLRKILDSPSPTGGEAGMKKSSKR